jgi:hypothetical protein
MDCSPFGNRETSAEARQNDDYFVSDQQSDYQSKAYVSDEFCSKQSSICKIKEKETKTGLRLLLTLTM